MRRCLALWFSVFGLTLFLTACTTPQPTPAGTATQPLPATATPTEVLPTATPRRPTATPRIPPPQLEEYSPLGGELVNLLPTVALTFDQAMDKASVLAGLQIVPALQFNSAWVDNTLLLTPTAPLSFNTQYTFTLTTNALSQRGTPITEMHTWVYTVPPFVAGALPPAAGVLTSPFHISLNYTLPQDVTNYFTITPALSGVVRLSPEGRELFFYPESFDHQTQYVLHFTAPIADVDGNPLPPIPSITLETPAPLSYVGPQGELLPGLPLVIEFLQPMDEATTVNGIFISPTLTGTWGWEGPRAIFTPTRASLLPNTTYTVTISPLVRAADGAAPFIKPHNIHYATHALQNPVSFGEGLRVQVLALTGTRTLQYHIAPNAPLNQVDVQVYRLTLPEFVAQATGPFAEASTRNIDFVEVDDFPLARAWSVQPALHYTSTIDSFAEELPLPADLPPGLYLLNLALGEVVNDQLLVVLTEQNVLVKRAADEVTAWVTTSSGEVRGNTEVTIYTRSGQQLVQGRTNSRGVYQENLSRAAQPFIVTARYGTDVTMVGFGEEWRILGALSASRLYTQQYAAHIYTERPIYRPGQTVYFKAIVRRDEDAVLTTLPTGRAVLVQFYDARANLVQSQTLTTTAFGTVHSSLVLAEGAMLGQYRVEVSIGGERHAQTFNVQDYAKPDYTLTLTPEATRYGQGEIITVAVDARYFYGAPVPNAKLTLRQFALDAYCQPWCLTPEHWNDLRRPVLAAQTDATGQAFFTLPAEIWDEQSMTALVLEATADDGSHQTVNQAIYVQVFKDEVLLEVQLDHLRPQPNEPFKFTVQAQTVAAKPVANLPLTLTLTQIGLYDEIVQTQTITTDPTGQAVVSLALAEAGLYEVLLEGQAADQPLHHIQLFDVGGIVTTARFGVTLEVDKAAYAPGDIAQVTITSPFSGPALLTLERGTTRREQLVTLQVPTTVLTLPLEATDAPNVYLTLNSWQVNRETLGDQATSGTGNYHSLPDKDLVLATLNLPVPVLNKALSLTLTSDQPTYAPGATAQFTVQVTNAQGQPVVAEVSLALVEETLFGLRQNTPTHISADFYTGRKLGVETYHAFALVRTLVETGGQGAGTDVTPFNFQRDFPDTALWVPVIETDANGVAHISLTLPDSLTQWRLTAKAVTVDTQVGEAHLNIETQKTLVVQPFLPPTLLVGDMVEVAARVQNNSTEPHTVTVSIESDLLEFLDSGDAAALTVGLAPGEQKVVGRTAQTRAAGPVVITTTAVVSGMPTVNDGVVATLTVQPMALPEVDTQIGEVTETVALSVTLPGQALPMSTVRLDLSRALAGNVLFGLDYLTGFPYGCVEQTMSRALPNAVVGRAYRQLGLDNPALLASLPAKVSASLQRLYGLQHTDGGWGWWWDDTSDAYQTAWVVYGLAVTRQAGYTVDEAVIERGAKWLQAEFETMDTPTQMFTLYALAEAGHGDLATARRFEGETLTLDPFSRAALALAFYELRDTTEARVQLALLARAAVRQGDWVYWETGLEDGTYAAKTMASATRATALALSAFARIQPNHSVVAGTVRYLTAHRQSLGWGTTNETAFTLVALTDYLRTRSNTTAVTRYTVLLNGERIANGALTRDEPTLRLDIPAAQMQTGVNNLQIIQTGSGRLYYTLSRNLYRSQSELQAEGSVEVTRYYLDPATDKQLTQVQAGQLVKVKITVNAPAAFYMLVEDHLPGGLAALNENLNTTGYVGQSEALAWESYGYNYKEIRAGRVSFFVTEWGAVGERTFVYYARALRPGQFMALPAEAYAMYDPTLRGRSDSQHLTVLAVTAP